MFSLIRICPDWNVKVYVKKQAKEWLSIRICPDWNVKAFKILQKQIICN